MTPPNITPGEWEACGRGNKMNTPDWIDRLRSDNDRLQRENDALRQAAANLAGKWEGELTVARRHTQTVDGNCPIGWRVEVDLLEKKLSELRAAFSLDAPKEEGK